MRSRSSYCVLWKGEELREDLKEKIDRGDEFVLLEVFSEASYRQAHLPGAIRFQNMGMIPDLLTDMSTEVVAYCSNVN